MEHHIAWTSSIPYSGEDWFDPLEDAIRFRVRAFIEALVEEEAQAALGGRALSTQRPAQGLSQRSPAAAACRHLRSADGVASPRPPSRRGWR